MKKAKADRRTNDHYVTPAWAIQRFLEAYQPPARGRILDPCAACGELLLSAEKFFPGALFGACEINPKFETSLREVTSAALIGDFLANVETLKACQFDFVLTNPPYAQAQDFVEAALQVAPTVAMLLRINFLASKRRREWLNKLDPGIFVLPNRPSFTGEGGDQTEYAWFVFGDPVVTGCIFYCELTPPEEIRRANLLAREIHTVESPIIPSEQLQAVSA